MQTMNANNNKSNIILIGSNTKITNNDEAVTNYNSCAATTAATATSNIQLPLQQLQQQRRNQKQQNATHAVSSSCNYNSSTSNATSDDEEYDEEDYNIVSVSAYQNKNKKNENANNNSRDNSNSNNHHETTTINSSPNIDTGRNVKDVLSASSRQDSDMGESFTFDESFNESTGLFGDTNSFSTNYESLPLNNNYHHNSSIDACTRALAFLQKNPNANITLLNFVLVSILVSANHGCVVTCLSLATAKLGYLGAWQNGILYLTYSLSAIIGSTSYIVEKVLGAHLSLIIGMATYSVFVICFWIAATDENYTQVTSSSLWGPAEQEATITTTTNTASMIINNNNNTSFANNNNINDYYYYTTEDYDEEEPVPVTLYALLGAVIGGFGAELMWTAHGIYFTQCTEEYSRYMEKSMTKCNIMFAQIFGYIYFTEEVIFRSLVTILLLSKYNINNNDNDNNTTTTTTDEDQNKENEEEHDDENWTWNQVLKLYMIITILCTILMIFTRNYYDPVKIAEDERRRKRRRERALQLQLQQQQCNSKTPYNPNPNDVQYHHHHHHNIHHHHHHHHNHGINDIIQRKLRNICDVLCYNSQMKYMICLNMIFGFSTALINSYVNGEVEYFALNDIDSKYVGVLSAWVSIVTYFVTLIIGKCTTSATASITTATTTATNNNFLSCFTNLFCCFSFTKNKSSNIKRNSRFHHTNQKIENENNNRKKGYALIFGTLCFLINALLFIILPNIKQQWNLALLLFIYTVFGIGRATYEGNLKSIFSEFVVNSENKHNKEDSYHDHHYQKEGVISNIILQNAFFSTIGYILSYNLLCQSASSAYYNAINNQEEIGEAAATTTNYCIRYKNDTFHDVFTFQFIMIIIAILAIIGFLRASYLHYHYKEEDVLIIVQEEIEDTDHQLRHHNHHHHRRHDMYDSIPQ